MTFTVEDGTGVENANSYSTTDFADAYFLERGNTVWGALTTAQKQTNLILATDYVELRFSHRFVGQLSTSATTLSWPRIYVYDRKNVLVTDVPLDIQKATCEYASRANISPLLPDPTVAASGQAIKRTLDKVGPIETEVEFEGASSRPDLIRPYPVADKLCVSWISGVGGVIR